MLEELATLARSAIADRVFPGCVFGVVHASGEREVLPVGSLQYNEASPEVLETTIYDLASVTKSIPVSSLAALFIAEGKLRLDDEVKQYLPELHHDFGATIEDLLRYRVRGPRMSLIGLPTFEQVRTYIFEKGFEGPPGESRYSNLPAFLLGIVLERAGGEILPALAQHYFFGPLEMGDTTFFPHAIERVAPTEVVGKEEVRGIVHDESARIFALRRRWAGHAGLFSTAPDLLRFLGALLQDAFPPVMEAAKLGLGWQLFTDERFGKTGFTGTLIALDPSKKIGFVMLSNRTYPNRPVDTSAINEFRKRAMEVVFSS